MLQEDIGKFQEVSGGGDGGLSLVPHHHPHQLRMKAAAEARLNVTLKR